MNEESKSVFLPGMTIGHRYEILRLLRTEAHGEVMLARDQVLDLDVGLKLLSNEHPEFSRLLEYYRREALWGLRLHHPQILGVHHLDETAEGVFLVLEPFAGNSLWELLGHSEALTINDSLYFIEVLAQGVAYGHKHGVNHQNFNPQQVLVSATDGIKIINLAFPAEPSEIHAFPEIQAYISPEVWQGQRPTAASNLFSLGVIGYRMLTGTFPFPLQAGSAIPYQISSEPAAFDNIPDALKPLFSRCLKPEPEKRFQSAADFLSRLAALREKLTPGYALKNKSLETEVVAPPIASNQKTAPQAIIGSMEPEVEIDPDWQEANGFHRQSLGEKMRHWFTEKQQRVVDFFGSEPLRRNRHKQVAAAIGGGIAFLLLILGLNSLFSAKPKLKMIPQPNQVVGDSATPALQTPTTAKPPVMAASPAATPEINADQPGTKPHLDESKTTPDTTIPLAVPVPTTKKPATPAQTKAEKAPANTEKSVAKTATHATEAKAAKSTTSPKLVATIDKEIPARKKADALTKQGHPAIVRKAKQGNKTVYQVWLTAATESPAKTTAPVKPKAAAKSNAAKPR
jgi:eukaryotic-like serine/threonine-protein kinase